MLPKIYIHLTVQRVSMFVPEIFSPQCIHILIWKHMAYNTNSIIWNSRIQNDTSTPVPNQVSMLSVFLFRCSTHLYSHAVWGWNDLCYTHCSPCQQCQGDSCTVLSLHGTHHSRSRNGYSYMACRTHPQAVGSQTIHNCTCFKSKQAWILKQEEMHHLIFMKLYHSTV